MMPEHAELLCRCEPRPLLVFPGVLARLVSLEGNRVKLPFNFIHLFDQFLVMHLNFKLVFGYLVLSVLQIRILKNLVYQSLKLREIKLIKFPFVSIPSVLIQRKC